MSKKIKAFIDGWTLVIQLDSSTDVRERLNKNRVRNPFKEDRDKIKSDFIKVKGLAFNEQTK